MENKQNEIILYQTDNTIEIEVSLEKRDSLVNPVSDCSTFRGKSTCHFKTFEKYLR